MIRLVILALAILIFFLLTIPFFGITWIIGRSSPEMQSRIELAFVRNFCRLLLFLAGVRLARIGLEKVPDDQSVVYIINHRSFFDIPMIYAAARSPVGFISKKEVGRVPILNWWLVRLHGLYIDRENIREGLKTILAAIEQVKSGISIAVFPEGTRGKEPDERNMLPFHEGTFKIATKSGALVVPVVISGSSAILEDHFPRVKSTPVILEYLDPVDLSVLTGEEKKFPGRYVQSLMQEAMNRNHSKIAG